MEKVELLCVGTVREPALRQLIAEYQKRLLRFCTFNIIELDEKPLVKEAPAQISRALDSEGECILKKLDNSFNIALCVEGKKYDSVSFANLLEKVMLQNSKLKFIIGSSYGLSDAVKQKADVRLSLSAMTFPHQLSRLILIEQIYRAYKIRANEKYNK